MQHYLNTFDSSLSRTFSISFSKSNGFSISFSFLLSSFLPSPFPSALQTSPVLRHTSLSAPPRFVVARTKLHELKFFKSFSFFLLPLLLEQHPGEKRFRDCARAAMLAQRFYELFCNSPDRASSITPSPSPSGEG